MIKNSGVEKPYPRPKTPKRKAKRPSLKEINIDLGGLFTCVLTDVQRQAGVKTSDIRKDVDYSLKRLSAEGLSFLTKVLPKLGKAVLSALQSKRLLLAGDIRLKRCHRGGAFPGFLSGLLKTVFDDRTGDLKESASATSVWAVEQICFLFYKLEAAYTEEQVKESLMKVVEVNESLPPSFTDDNLDLRDRTILALARNIIIEMMEGVNFQDIRPRHGPGSTAVGPLTLNEKFALLLSSRLMPGYPEGLYARIIETTEDRISTRVRWEGTSIAVSFHRESVLHPVPKDSRGPRWISCEPCQNMWIQQGIRSLLESRANQYSRGRINFDDQSVNQILALEASEWRGMATLDMKDASDRVSVSLVQELFALTSAYVPLMASRSISTRFVDPLTKETTQFQLRKFAPMGSAVCFPVESIVFWSLAVASINYFNSQQDHHCEVADPREVVYVFGDDLIVPCIYADVVMESLEKFSLRFNRDKCFIHGRFRESCGVDAFDGVCVSPIKVKTLPPRSRSDADAVAAWVDYANLFAQQWCFTASEYIWKYLDVIIPNAPVCKEPIGLFHKFTFSSPVNFGEGAVGEVDRLSEVDIDECLELVSLPVLHSILEGCSPRGKGVTPYYQGKVYQGYGLRIRKIPKKYFDEEAGLLEFLSSRGDKCRPYGMHNSEPYEALRYDPKTVIRWSRVMVS
jgi:hypothetical protein